LRGLALVDLGQLKVDALGVLLPRITLPPQPGRGGQHGPGGPARLRGRDRQFLLQKARRTDALAQ
jgi:hypothetical protein